LEVPHLEVLDVDLVMEQNRGLKGTESQAVFCAYILVVINEFATSAWAFDGFGKSEHGCPPEANEYVERGSAKALRIEHIFTICQAKTVSKLCIPRPPHQIMLTGRASAGIV